MYDLKFIYIRRVDIDRTNLCQYKNTNTNYFCDHNQYIYWLWSQKLVF